MPIEYHLKCNIFSLQLTSYFGDSAMKCQLMLFLRHILDYPSFKKKGDGVYCLIKSHVYIILSMILKIFQEDTLGDFQVCISGSVYPGTIRVSFIVNLICGLKAGYLISILNNIINNKWVDFLSIGS